MSAQRKTFRIETLLGTAPAPAASDATRHAELLAEIRALRRLVEPQEEVASRVFEAYRNEIAEAHKLKGELDSIAAAIADTKREIASVHLTGFNGARMARVSNELDAVVAGTEDATSRILEAAEQIDQDAAALVAAVKADHDRAMAADIQDRVIAIFEACNFQDLTGQRITKVVTTLSFIEERIVRMMEIWGGIESFREVEIAVLPDQAETEKLLHGPKLDGDTGHVDQDDIDALFA